MISLCSAIWTYRVWRRRLRGTKKWQVPRPVLIRAKVCGWVPGEVAYPRRILELWFGPGLQLERNWSEVRAKVEAYVGTWLRRRLSLKGRAEVCALYIFPLILYHLFVLHLPRCHRVTLKQFLSKLLWKDRSPMARRQVYHQHPRNGVSRDAGSGEPLARWKTGQTEPILVEGHGVGTKVESFSSPEVQSRSPASAIWPSVNFLCPMTFLSLERNCIKSWWWVPFRIISLSDSCCSTLVTSWTIMFPALLAVARMVNWETRNKGLYDDANFSHRDLILFFRHQLRVKIRCDRKRFDRITSNKIWVYALSLVVRKGAMLESSFPPISVRMATMVRILWDPNLGK